MNLRTVTEFVRLMAAVAVAVRAGILLHRTISDQVAEAMEDKVDGDDAPTYPPGSIGAAIQDMARKMTSARSGDAKAH